MLHALLSKKINHRRSEVGWSSIHTRVQTSFSDTSLSPIRKTVPPPIFSCRIFSYPAHYTLAIQEHHTKYQNTARIWEGDKKDIGASKKIPRFATLSAQSGPNKPIQNMTQA